MKYFPLVWAGLWRKRARTVLTSLSVVTAFLLFGVLDGGLAGLDYVLGEVTDRTRLVVLNRVSISASLPYGYLARIESVPGVASVDFYQPFGGFYRDRHTPLGGNAIDVSRYFQNPRPDFTAPRDQLEMLQRMRTGALVGEDLARRQGLKIGDRLPLQSPGLVRRDGSTTWTFDIVGIYRRPDGPAEGVRINYDYFDEARAFGNGTVMGYQVRTRDIAQMGAVGAAIDRLFANSSYQTRSQSETDLVRSQISEVADIQLIVAAIVSAVFFTLLFVAGNTMMESIRERIPELAVLKTCGYTDRKIAGLVLAEAGVLCVGGALVGLALAAALFPIGYAMLGIAVRPISPGVVGLGLAVASGLALLTALPPAWRAGRLTIIDALAVR